ncbi:MAG: PilC/PilY family type IV pilus protein [Variovorax sp.]
MRLPTLRHSAAASAILLLAAASWFAVSAPAPVKLVELSSEPLSASAGGQKPTLALALSVEFPTVGAQYLDAHYASTREYIGYFDAQSCYAYVNDADPGLRRFDRIAAAPARRCGGSGFSGNFLNWATSSAIDVLRLGLTGGDRIVDTPNMTVLQRAVLYRDHFYNDSNFPNKQLPSGEAEGAVPRSLRGTWTGDISIANCLNRVHFGTAATGTCDSPGDNANLGVPSAGGALQHGTAMLSSDRFFYTRVKVCESNGVQLGDPRADYCLRYPAGNFKPVGNLQKYSDRVRVAAFGYLMDSTNQRYGGVLRAPMKFVGAKSYDASGVLQAGNSKVEWDLATGVFNPNPEDAAEGRSGVINYLNQFGRTGAVEGAYKTYDPVGELYYEALRYLQGLPPTAEAVAGITDAMKDGFPAYTHWTDPHEGGSPSKNYSCLRNNILAIGDVNTHNDKSFPGNTTRLASYEFARSADTAANEPDFTAWTRVVGAFEAATSLPYPDGSGRSTSNPNAASDVPRAPQPVLADIATADTGADRAGYYMAGAAYWANTHDIRGTQWTREPARQRPGMRATTYVLDVNEFNGDAELGARRQKQFFLAAKYGGFRDKSGYGNPFLNKDGALDNSAWESDAADGDPRNYYLSSSAQNVIKALDDIFMSLAAASNSIAAGDVPSTRVTTGESAYIYQASFNPDQWSGDVRALALTVDANGSLNVGDAGNAPWSAATQLDAAMLPSARNIVIGRVDATRAVANAFRWSELEDAAAGYSLKTALDKPLPAAGADGLGEQRLDFLRGDRSLEGTTFRRRSSRLGDFVNSGVAWSGAPSRGYSSSAYLQFYAANKDRTKAIFAGANDGMLHAFDAATGNELFGYIPSWMGPHLATLASTSYNSGLHRSYVDATPRIAEAEFANGDWKTVLVGGTGAGGQGVFALDVTNPAAFDASKVLWEFTDRDDVDMGNVIGRPRILKLRTSAPTATGAPTYRSFAVVASGVNNSQPDGFASTSGSPALFLLDLSKPIGTAWTLNRNYFKIVFPVDGTLTATVAPGLIDFSATTGAAGEVQLVYAGDLYGNLWKLDFARNGSATWDLAHLAALDTPGTATPLFIARDGAGQRQPISMAPKLIAAPNRTLLVSFGTGKYLEATDSLVSPSTQLQSIYTLFDGGSQSGDPAGSASVIAGRGRLMAGTANAATGVVTMPAFVWGRPATDGDATQRAGWFFDLPVRGERQLSPMDNFGRTLVAASLIPPAAASEVCGSGSGHLYTIDIANGSGNVVTSTVGALGAPVVMQVNDATSGSVGSDGRGTSSTRGRVFVPGANSPFPLDVEITKQSVFGVLNWRRIDNYLDLKNATPN